jgi:hypothetical protein
MLQSGVSSQCVASALPGCKLENVVYMDSTASDWKIGRRPFRYHHTSSAVAAYRRESCVPIKNSGFSDSAAKLCWFVARDQFAQLGVRSIVRISWDPDTVPCLWDLSRVWIWCDNLATSWFILHILWSHFLGAVAHILILFVFSLPHLRRTERHHYHLGSRIDGPGKQMSTLNL